MARQLRVEYPGAVYHVMSRGNNFQSIYLSDTDRRCFLQTLAEICEQMGWRVHAYVMMSNHYHLLLETPEANLVAGMKWFQGTYTQRFNAANRRRGHLYQGRYKALIVDPEEDGYFNTVSTYIHLNPFRAGLTGVGCKQPLEAYAWSSYPAYLLPPGKQPEWLESRRVLDSFGIHGQGKAHRMRYQSLMEERMAFENEPAKAREVREEYQTIRRGWVLGEGAFRDWILEKMEEGGQTKGDNCRGTQRSEHGVKAAEGLIAKAIAELQIDERTLLALKQVALEKQAVAWLLQTKTSVTNVWIADRLNMGHRVNVSRGITRFRRADERDVKRMKKKMIICTDPLYSTCEVADEDIQWSILTR